jgi:transcription elongation GreA/GreB family factor
MSTKKEQLYQLCTDYIAQREAETKAAIAEAREAANNETKSSAGDKYETAREMMAQDINLNMSRLSELQKLKAALSLIPVSGNCTTVQSGAVVHTSNGNFYLAVSAGVLHIDGRRYYAISPSSPMGIKLAGHTTGDIVELNGKHFTIERVE